MSKSVLEMTPQISLDEYRSFFRNHPGGVAVITVDGDRPVGFTASSVISISANPPLLVFSIDRSSSSWAAVKEAANAAVHLISSEGQNLAARFSTSGVDRFEGLDWTRLNSGVPLISGVGTWATGSILSKTECGTAALVVMQIEESNSDESHVPLVYHSRAYHELSERSKIC